MSDFLVGLMQRATGAPAEASFDPVPAADRSFAPDPAAEVFDSRLDEVPAVTSIDGGAASPAGEPERRLEGGQAVEVRSEGFVVAPTLPGPPARTGTPQSVGGPAESPPRWVEVAAADAFDSPREDRPLEEMPLDQKPREERARGGDTATDPLPDPPGRPGRTHATRRARESEPSLTTASPRGPVQAREVRVSPRHEATDPAAAEAIVRTTHEAQLDPASSHPRTEPAQAEPAVPAPLFAPLRRRERPAAPPPRPIQVRIGTVEVSAPPPAPVIGRPSTSGPLGGFDGYRMLRTYRTWRG